MAAVGISLLLISQQISPYISYSFPLETPSDQGTPTSVVNTPTTLLQRTQPSPTGALLDLPIATIIQQAQVPQHQEIPQELRQVSEKVLQKDFSLVIPKIGVEAPIIPNVDGGNSDVYLKSLENGVAHFAGTSFPNDPGRVFVFGHSSYFRNKPGNYKKIFAGLDGLVNGDDVMVWFKGDLLRYRVVEKKFVMPSDLSVLAPTAKKTLTLQACWPIGSTKERIIINAEQVE